MKMVSSSVERMFCSLQRLNGARGGSRQQLARCHGCLGPGRWRLRRWPAMAMERRDRAPERPSPRRRRPPSERDPLAAAWRVIDALWREECEPQRAQAIIAALRLVFAAGQAPLERDRALREAELLGLLMHGLPPRDEAERALAEELGVGSWEEVG